MNADGGRKVVTPPTMADQPTKSGQRLHLLLGTLICLATMGLLLAFRGSLPALVPLQFRLDGSTANYVPRDVFVFGVPLAF